MTNILVVSFFCANFVKSWQLMYLGELIKSHREQEQLSQKVVADAIGVDVPMYSRMERGQRPIKKEQIKVLSDLLKIQEMELYKYWVAEKVYNIKQGKMVCKAV